MIVIVNNICRKNIKKLYPKAKFIANTALTSRFTISRKDFLVMRAKAAAAKYDLRSRAVW